MIFPFPGGVESQANGELLLSFGAALLYLLVIDGPLSWRSSIVKTLAVALLAVLAWQQGGPTMLIVALALSAVGDAFLSRPGDTTFLGGLAAFLAAHIAYIVLFSQTGAGPAILMAEPWRLALALVMLITTAMVLFVLLQRVPPSLRLPVAAYGLAILAMGLTALTMHNWAIIIGAVLFMMSDTMLSWERFVLPGISSKRKLLRPLVWVTYYAAQALITLGLLL